MRSFPVREMMHMRRRAREEVFCCICLSKII